MLTDHNEIREWIIKNTSADSYPAVLPDFIVRLDGVVDIVRGGIEILSVASATIPVQFGNVKGNFRVQYANIKSLDWLPSYIDRGFLDISINHTHSLSGIDKVVKHVAGEVFPAAHSTHMLGLLLIDGVTHIGSVSSNDPVYRILNRYVGTGDILSAQDELIDAGLIDQARL
jgi:hypothetical protein